MMADRIRYLATPRVTLRGKTISITHVHEAGHALGYFISRRAWGYEWNKTISSMDIGDISQHRRSAGSVLISAATTYTPWFTPPMEEAHRSASPRSGEYDRRELCRQVVDRSRAAGLDIEQWARGYIVGSVAGSVAEAVYLGKDVPSVLMADANASDRDDALLAFLCWKAYPSMGGHEQEFALVIQDAVQVALRLIKCNRKAITALALALPRQGVFPGERAVEILMQHFVMPPA